MSKIHVNDKVVVRTGKDKGRTGVVLRVLPRANKLVVEGVNVVKKHVRANPQLEQEGGIKQFEKPVHISNVAIYNGATGKADRVGFKVLEDGTKIRVFKSTGEQI